MDRMLFLFSFPLTRQRDPRREDDDGRSTFLPDMFWHRGYMVLDFWPPCYLHYAGSVIRPLFFDLDMVHFPRALLDQDLLEESV